MTGWVVMTVASLLAIAVPAGAGPPTDRVQAAVTSVIGIVTRPDLQGEANRVARRALLRNSADRFFDFREMSRRSLGSHWATPSEKESVAFLALFKELLGRSYATTIENHAGEQIVYLGEVIDDRYATVRSTIVTTRGAKIGVDYRLRHAAGGWSVFDVALENVSLVANYREQINRVLRTASFAELLARMRTGQLAAVAIPREAGSLGQRRDEGEKTILAIVRWWTVGQRGRE